MANKTADAIKLVLRLPKPLHKRLKQRARRNNVSLNTEIVNQLSLSNPKAAILPTPVLLPPEAMSNIIDPRIAAQVQKAMRGLEKELRDIRRAVLEREKGVEQK